MAASVLTAKLLTSYLPTYLTNKINE